MSEQYHEFLPRPSHSITMVYLLYSTIRTLDLAHTSPLNQSWSIIPSVFKDSPPTV
ncbi:hypothetical protein DFA_11630 [Cavenderia fasciculata]|uniref:Uncharacterized protein n=1 Tax=Cavenderia fasciculata TaxID=261658 RepID=F4QDS2_CACFS|nr:uncharacterized protein DFA_11630 [Cavenderia fasciculata]EGG13869.1 hypothetical protein DFA_11630 [Cavenderia fasciculata]|eukprot:XP_004350577.1 hypothetical protein DFA_11630 [Cavenderia fasciculata]